MTIFVDREGKFNPGVWFDEWKSPPVMKLGEAQHYSLGSDGKLSKSDEESIKEHFRAIIAILTKSGMDKQHILEFWHGLIDNWWIDTCIKVSLSIVGTIT